MTKPRSFTAIVWIGRYGLWYRRGFPTYAAALQAARYEISRGVWGDRTDLVPDVKEET